MQYLIVQEVDAIVFYYREPIFAERAVADAHAAGIPIVLHGTKPPITTHAPFVGNDVYHIGIKTGEKTANLFKQRFPGIPPKLLIAESNSEKKDAELEKGFVEGMLRLLPGLHIERTVDYRGFIEGTREMVFYKILDNPDLNIFFGTGDDTVMGILRAAIDVQLGSISA